MQGLVFFDKSLAYVHVYLKIKRLSTDSKSKELDISLAHPWSKDTVKRAARENGYAAIAREKRKRTKYDQQTVPGGSTSDCTPVVFEHFGHWGVEAENLLNELAQKSKNLEGRKNSGEFKTFWRCRFSIVLQRCNSRVILNKISRISSSSEEPETLFNRDIQISVH